MGRFKRIYVEITNKCNLNCSFCSIDNNEKQDMSFQNFIHIIGEIKKYSNYIYLHVKGEPLLHPEFDKILEICDANKINVDITTNGTLLEKRKLILLSHSCVHHINVSLHTETNDLEYFKKVFNTCSELSSKISISYRIWTMTNGKFDKKSTTIVNKIIEEYNLSTDIVEKIYKDININISENISVNKANLFEWPDLKSKYYCEDGFCRGLITHIAILVDGRVVPCCLDSKGINELGNIYNESLDNIINKEKTNIIKSGFINGCVTEELCKHCSYKSRFDK